MKSPIDKMLKAVAWIPVSNHIPQSNNNGLTDVTHTGVFKFGIVEFRCYQLSDDRRLLDAEDVEKVFGHIPKGWSDNGLVQSDIRNHSDARK